MCFVFYYLCYHEHSTHFKLVNLQTQTLPLHLITIVLCVYYRIDGDSEDISETKSVEILDLSHFKQSQYISAVVKSFISKAFLKSKSYMSVLQRIENKNMDDYPICISGPKGVGKTMCLLALMSELQKKQGIEPVFVTSLSFQDVNQTLTLDYLGEVAEKIGFKKEINSSRPIGDWLCKLMLSKNSQSKPFLLMDFDKLNDSDIVESMSTTARTCSDYAVLAVSSGNSVVTDVVAEQSFLLLRQQFWPLQYLPFTEKEMGYFITYHELKFTADELIPITGYNPCLLSLASKCKNLTDVIEAVDGYVHSFIQDNLKVSDSLPEKFVGSLKRSEEYFWMASVNDTLQGDHAIIDFNSSWVAEHKVCYLEDNTIKINFPRLPQMLQADIRA